MKKTLALILVLFIINPLFPQSTTEQKLDKLLTAYYKCRKFNGSVLVARCNKVLLEKGYGFKNFNDSTLNNPGTIFQIASVTKQFTSAVILKLTELQQLTLTDKLSSYWPDFPNGINISIENLLSHTSGIYDWTNNTIGFSPTGEKTLIAFLKTKNPVFPPGTNWRYSNSNYSLLGYIIEKVTGLSYENAVRKYIFNPLQMTDSGFDFKHLINKEKAIGYSNFSDNPKIEGILYDSVGPYAAGEIFSTVKDLYKWHRGLEANKIISRESLEKAYTPIRNHYGYGWQIDSLFGKRVTSHSGSISGFSSNLARIEEDSVVVVLLNNNEESSLETITNKILAILYDQPYSLPSRKHSVNMNKHTLKKYTGAYSVESPHGAIPGEVIIFNGKLCLQAYGSPILELYAESENHFFDPFEEDETCVDFEVDSSGKVDRIILSLDGIITSGKKVK
jgi:CubicO group peptidase (beta-lactamase class C family)